MRQTIYQWLQTQRSQARQAPQRPRQPLSVAGHVVGSVEADFARQLGELSEPGAPLLRPDGDLWILQGAGDASQSLNHLAHAMRAAGLAGAWRNEQLAVCDERGQRIATIERAAVRPLGIATQAVHLIGHAPDGCVWVQQRADDKPTHPGRWDTLMGGMVSAADTLEQAVARETWEEAGLHVADLHGLRHGGHVDFARPSDEAEGQGYMRERIDWYEAVVPAGLVPDNQDGEVQGFALIDRRELEAWLLADRFTPEAALILAAWLEWD